MADRRGVVHDAADRLGDLVPDRLGLAEVEDQPYIRGFFAFASIWAVYSIASSYETSLYEPSSCCIRGRVMRSFAWEWRNFSAPIAQAL